MILTRRKFLQRLGYMMAGGLIVPYVPKVFYSIPGTVEPPRMIIFGKIMGIREYMGMTVRCNVKSAFVNMGFGIGKLHPPLRLKAR